MVTCFSHGIPGTLWQVNGGADRGRGKVGRTGSPSLLTASSGAVRSGSGCSRCHAGSSGKVTASAGPGERWGPSVCQRRALGSLQGLLIGHLLDVVAQQLVLLCKRERCYFVDGNRWHRQAGPALLVGKSGHIRNSEGGSEGGRPQSPRPPARCTTGTTVHLEVGSLKPGSLFLRKQ